MNILNNQKVEQIDLKFGARLLNVIVPNLPLSIVSVWFRAGSRFDPVGREGLAHFFEHLFLTRTKNYPTRQLRLQHLEANGIFSNAFVNREAACYYQMQSSEKFYDSLKLLMEGLNNPIITAEALEAEKEIILDEAQKTENNLNKLIWHFNLKSLFKGSALGKGFFGTSESIRVIKLQDILTFQKNYYNYDNLFFVVIGNEDTNKLKDFINNRIGEKPKSKTIFSEDKFSKPDFINIQKKDTDNIFVGLNYRLPKVNTKEQIVLDFINKYLANSWISKLIVKLRLDNNLTYWVNGESVYFYDHGALNFVFSVVKSNLTKALKLARQEIDSLKIDNISEESLAGQKNSFKAFLLRNLIDPYDLLWWYAYPALLDKEILTPQDYLKQIEAITTQDIKGVAGKYLTKENLVITAIGNLAKKDLDIS